MGPSQNEAEPVSQHILFDAGGLDLAAPAELIKAIHETLTIQSVAGTRKWFRGLAVANGKLLPVTDMGAFCGRRSSSGRTLELHPQAGIAGLQVDAVIGLSNTPVSDLPPTTTSPTVSGDTKLTLTGRAIVHNERVHRVLDIAALVQSPAFLNISHADNQSKVL